MIAATIITIKIGIHYGENTHHQDQVATTPQPPSLSVKKIKNRIVPIPIPSEPLLSFSMMLMYEQSFKKPN